MRSIQFGDLVRRRRDPVHTGRVLRVRNRTSHKEMTVDIVWLKTKVLERDYTVWLKTKVIERDVPIKDLEKAEDWK
jgi:hypothetical protein